MKDSFVPDRTLYFSPLAQSRWITFWMFLGDREGGGCTYRVLVVYSVSLFQRCRMILNDTHDDTRDTSDRRIYSGQGGGGGNPLTMEISPFPGVAFCMRRAEKARESRY